MARTPLLFDQRCSPYEWPGDGRAASGSQPWGKVPRHGTLSFGAASYSPQS
jgi:hypothetical protein